MSLVIELSPEGEELLRRAAEVSGRSREEIAQDAVERAFAPSGGRRIVSTPDTLGGDHRVDGSRIAVWMLAFYKQGGMSDEEILDNFPTLDAADLASAWEFYALHPDLVERERARHDEED